MLVTNETVGELVDRIMSDRDLPIAFDTETTGLSPVSHHIVGFSVSCTNRHGVYLPLRHERILEEEVQIKQGRKKLGPPKVLRSEPHPLNLSMDVAHTVMRAIEESGRVVAMHNASFDLAMSHKEGWLFPNPVVCTRVAKWQLCRGMRPMGKLPFGLKTLARKDLDHEMTEFFEVADPRGIQFSDPEASGVYAADDARSTLRLWHRYEKEMRETWGEAGFLREFLELEMPVVRVVAHMRRSGMLVDKEMLVECHTQVVAEQVKIQKKLDELIEGEFPTSKTQKLSRLMYDQLEWWTAEGMERGAARAKDDPQGFYSTDGEALLDQLQNAPEKRGKHVAVLLLRWRKLETMRSRYTISLAELADVDGRIRANFNQTGTETGRFSSSNPNMQNAPRPSDDEAKEVWLRHLPKIRAAFVAAPGRKLIDIDFSQIELRWMAHYSQDPKLLAAYRTWRCGACGGSGEVDVVRYDCPNCGVSEMYEKDGKLKKAKMSLDGVPHPGSFCLGMDIHQLTSQETGASRQDSKPINFGLCIAEGQRVLTHVGLVPIEKVGCWHLVWDGLEWVNHDGVVDMGVRRVITHDGLSATPDHEVYTDEGYKVRFSDVASSLRFGRLAVGAVGDRPARYVAYDRARGATGAESPLRRSGVFGLSGDSLASRRQREAWEDQGLHVPAEQEVRWRSEGGDVGSEVRRYGAAVREGFARLFASVQGAWDQGPLRLAGALHPVGAFDVPFFDLRGDGLRPHGQHWPLLTGESSSRDTLGESPQQGVMRRVYDIRNAGPRHRFTVEGKVVSNCYGMGPWLLSQMLDISIEEAQHYYSRYFNAYPGVRKWHRWVERQLREHWFVRTMSGRHRRFDKVTVDHDEDGRPKGKYGHTFRAAANTIIQGSAADLMKLAMRNVYRNALESGELDKRFWILSTVHDELICEATDDYAEEAARMMKYEFEHAVKLRVPVVADPAIGLRWSEVH